MHEHREPIPAGVIGRCVHQRNFAFLGDVDRLAEFHHVRRRSSRRWDNDWRLKPLGLHGGERGHLFTLDLVGVIERPFEATVDACGVVCDTHPALATRLGRSAPQW